MAIFFKCSSFKSFSLLLIGLISVFSSFAKKKYFNSDTIPFIGNFDYYVSDRGSDSNDGKSAAAPKRNLSSIETLISNTASQAPGLSLNLEENSVFREEYDPVNNNIHMNNFSRTTQKRLAKITGMDEIDDWTLAPSSANMYLHSLTHSIDLSNPGYTDIIIAEIDTTLEKTRAVSAVKYLARVPDIATCELNPGTYYAPEITTNPLTVYMHPSQGIPQKNKFRYEVSTRNFNISGFYLDNASYENLFFQTSAYGFGMLAAGTNSTIRNDIFMGGGIHHTVIKSGHMDSCLFLPGPKGLKDRLAAVFYNAEGKGLDNKVTNTMFLNIPSPLYSHTDGNVNYRSLIIDNVYAFADTTDAGTGLSASDTDSIEVSNCYMEGYPTGWSGGATTLNIKNSMFRNTDQSAIMLLSKANVTGQVNISNTLVVTNGNDNNQNQANGWTAFAIRAPYSNVNVDVSNSIFHCNSTWHELYNTVTAYQVMGSLKAHHNIYICDVNDVNSIHVNKADNSGGKGTSTNVSSDYNAFILLRGTKFNWIAAPINNGESNLSSLAEWQTWTGQDKNSIFIDLRNNPLGLKAIFVDPASGNWTLNQSALADSLRKISAAMTTPPLFYPKRPLIENDGIPFKTPASISSLNGSMQTEVQSSVHWQTFNESGFLSFTVEYSLDSVHFNEAGTLTPANDSKSDNYQFINSHPPTDSIYYRLKSLYTDSSFSYSAVVKLNGNFSQEFKIVIFPNPFQQSITVVHPRRKTGEIRIYDYLGKIVKNVKVIPDYARTAISLPDLPKGRYFIQWSSNQEKFSGAVIK